MTYNTPIEWFAWFPVKCSSYVFSDNDYHLKGGWVWLRTVQRVKVKKCSFSWSAMKSFYHDSYDYYRKFPK